MKYASAIHYFVCSLGLIGLSKYLSLILGSFLFKSHERLQINEYLVAYFFYPEKRYELLHYSLILALLVSYYFCVHIIFNRIIRKRQGSIENFSSFLTAEIVVLCFNLILLNPHNIRNAWRLILGVCLWLILLFAPLLQQYLELSQRKLDRYYYVVLSIVIVQFIFVFSPFIIHEPKMINEFLDIPEKTFIQKEGRHDNYSEKRANNSDKDYLTLIDNSTFINHFRLFGTHLKYDLLNDKGQDPVPSIGNYILFPKTPNLQNFINDKELNRGLKYYYDDRYSVLVAIDKISALEKTALSNLANEENNKKAIEVFCDSNAGVVQPSKSENYSGPVKDFLKKNAFEIHWQILNRWVIHHHNFTLAPMNEYDLGKNVKDIYAQYGLLNLIVTKKVLDLIGGLNYQNYLKTWFSYYYIYYGLLFVLIIFLFRDVKYATLIIILVSYLVTSVGFNYLFLGPGLNPIRHFFDIFTIALLFLYVTRKKDIWFYCLLLSSMLGVFNNAQVGLFSQVSLILVLIMLFVKNNEGLVIKRILPVVVIAAAGMYLAIWGEFGKDGFSKYYLEGLLGFPLGQKRMISVAVVISIGFAFMQVMLKIKDNRIYVALYLFFYSQALLVYYVWGATHNHFLNFAPIYALTIVLFLKLILNHYPFTANRQSAIIGILIFISLVAYASSLERYYTEKNNYDNIFTVHKTYVWDFERARFTSTMDPKYFQDAVTLINKYTPQNDIFILSKYDSIIPFLSHKYSAMPYFDVSNFLVTQKEINDCIAAVKDAKPGYLYVDTDISRNLNTDIIHENVPVIGYLHNESVWRVHRLRLLKDIYNAIRDDYHLVEKGYLISVYKRNDLGL